MLTRRAILKSIPLILIPKIAKPQEFTSPFSQYNNTLAQNLNQHRVAWWVVVPPYFGGSQWYDLVGMNHLNLTSSPTWANTNRPNGIGQLTFVGGSGQYATVAKSQTFNLSMGSISIWLNRSTNTPTSAFLSFEDNGGSFNNGFVMFFNAAADTMVTYLSQSAAYVYRYQTLGNYAVGSWHHFVVTVDASGNKFYGNNILLASNYSTGSASNTEFFSTIYSAAANFVIGRTSQGGPNYWDGGIDDVQLFNIGLSAAEVSMLYYAGPPDLMAANEFDLDSVQSAGYYRRRINAQ